MQESKRTDYYTVLGVEPGATEVEIQVAYLSASQTWRRRKAAAASPAARYEAEEMERLIRVARDVLLDGEQRTRYDAARGADAEAPALPAGPERVTAAGAFESAAGPSPADEEKKRCPYCGEWILAIAIKCKHCGEFLADRTGASRSSEASAAGDATSRRSPAPVGKETGDREKASPVGDPGKRRLVVPRRTAPPPGGEPTPGQVRTFAGMAFCYIPPGSFDMGSPVSEEGRSNSEVRHRVILTRGFWLKQTPVTNAEWERAMGEAAPSHFKGDDRPVECVSWHEAVAFCNALSRREGITEVYRDVSGAVRWDNLDARGYRLPTEAEWEHACRAGTVGARYGPLDEVAWYRSNSSFETHSVGQRMSNPWGLKDMLGSVGEWTWDWFGPYPNQTSDPLGPEKGSTRVSRGGSWDSIALFARAAYRYFGIPDFRYPYLGIRLARSRP